MGKILHLIGSFKEDTGGAQRVILDIINSCTDPQIEMGLCSLFEEATLAKYLPDKVYNRNLNYNFKKNPKIFINLYNIINNWNPDILHVHTPVAGIFGRPLAHLCNVKLVSTVHMNARFFDKKNSYINKLTLGLSDSIVCVSELVKESIQEEYSKIYNNSKIWTIPNCIDCHAFEDKINTDTKTKRKALNITKDDFLVGTVGRLHPAKGQKFLIKGWENVVEKYPESKLLIIGEGPERKQLKNLTKELNLDKSIIFLGARSDVPELLSLLDIFVLPSIWEGLPISLLEAMCAGKVILASDIKNIRNVIGKAGFLVKPKDSTSIGQCLSRIIDNYNDFKTYGDKAKQRVKDKYSPDEFGRNYTAMYKQILNDE